MPDGQAVGVGIGFHAAVAAVRGYQEPVVRGWASVVYHGPASRYPANGSGEFQLVLADQLGETVARRRRSRDLRMNAVLGMLMAPA